MITVNYLAILVAGIVSMVTGSIWYGPLFGKTWGRIIGMDVAGMPPEQKAKMQKGMGALYFANFILALLTAYILAHYIGGWQPAPGAQGGIINAFWIWLGFIMPTAAGGAMWSGKPKKLAWQMFWVTMSYQLVNFLIIGAILGAWK